MHAFRMAIWLTWALLGLAVAIAAETPVQRMKQSTVRVSVRETLGNQVAGGKGSGFWISPRHLVTNWHVCCASEGLAGGRVRTEIWIEMEGKGQVPLGVLWRSERLDLAILQTAEPQDVPVVRFASFEDIQDGEEVFAVGYPGASEEGVDVQTEARSTVTRGVVSRVFNAVVINNQEPVRKVQTDASISPGNSGGPLYNACGDVIGVNHAGMNRLYQTQRGDVVAIPTSGVNVAIHASQLIPPMKEHKISYRTASGGCSIESGSWLASVGSWTVQILTLCVALVAAALAWNRKVRENVSQRVGAVSQRLVAYRGALPTPRDALRAPPPAPAGRNAPPMPPPFLPPAPGAAGARPMNQGPPAGTATGLLGLSGQYQGSQLALDGTPLVFGRDPEVANLVFSPDCTQVSKRHCEVRFEQATGKFQLLDLGSSNGTYLGDGTRLSPGVPVQLLPGAHFYLGDRRQEFLFRQAGQGGR